VLERTLSEKLEAAARAGIAAHVVTQFCFDAEPVIAWLARFRGVWPETPVRIGLAGPAGLKALIRYAVRCGVKAPKTGLLHKFSLASRLARTIEPGGLIERVDRAGGRDANVAAHLFSFGGLERTARWALEYREANRTAVR
jgi:methylenetetrahydrofolate reductase (NADPH)